MRSHPVRLVVHAPATVLQLAAVAVFLLWASDQAGYPPTTWYPGALFAGALLVCGVLALPGRLRAVPAPVRVAGVALAAFTAWSYLAIGWSDARGEAWDGANRTALYLVLFLLFALWRHRGASAGVVLGGWTLGLGALAVATLLKVSAATDIGPLFVGDRLAEPAGYVNAAAALWLMALAPALVLAGRAEVPWWLRGAFAATAVVLVDAAILSQSRGSFIATPIVLALLFALVPGRARTFAVSVPVGVAVALTAPGQIDIASRLSADESPRAVLAGMAEPVLLAALATGLIVALAGVLETMRPVSRRTARRARLAVGSAGLGTLVAGVVAAVVVFGNPVDRLDDGWASFKQGYDYSDFERGETRLGLGLGSNRYDFYRVALAAFADRPLRGLGTDNFSHEYLVAGRSLETPRYPHSTPLRALSQTGAVGALLLLVALGAAAITALRAVRSRDRFDAAVAGAALMAFAYWLVHGSADWFWEFAGLGGPAFALLGLACSVRPRHDGGPEGTGAASAPLAARWPSRAAVLVPAALLAGSFGLPWAAEARVRSAAQLWIQDRTEAFARLDRAADLNPISERPHLIAGSVAVRLGDFERARREFELALERNPRDAYAYLELGAIASQSGQPVEARRLLRRARQLNPRDRVTSGAYADVASGQRLDVGEVNRAILARTRALTR